MSHFIKYVLCAVCSLGVTSATCQQTNLDAINELKSIVQGRWYEPAYFSELQKTKSPFISQRALAEFIELDIDTSQISEDSLWVSAAGIHEGYSFSVFLRKGKAEHAFPTSIVDGNGAFYELGYSVSGDTSLKLYKYTSDTELAGVVEYKKADDGIADPFQYLVNRTLLSGTYNIADGLNQGAKVKFTNEGVVSGLPPWREYYIVCDFVAGPDENIDQIVFEDSKGNQEWFTYLIARKKIELFQYSETDDHIVKRGKKLYTLTKD